MAKTIIGIVTSDKADKTIVVTAQTRKTHPIYRKQYTVSTKYIAHDEKNEAVNGDKVSIVETKPISKRKRFALDKIIERPELREEQMVTGNSDAETEEETRPPKTSTKHASSRRESEVEVLEDK